MSELLLNLVAPAAAESLGNKGQKVGIFYHSDCSKHDIEGHPECPDRVKAIMSALRSKLDQTGLSYHEAPRAADHHILLFHTGKLLSEFHRLCDRSKHSSYQFIDGDTIVMEHTREAAYRAVGAMIAAIDLVYQNTKYSHKISKEKVGADTESLTVSEFEESLQLNPPPQFDLPTNPSTEESPSIELSLPTEPIPTPLESLTPLQNTTIRSAFCCVRPPGHHASRSKACGFCFFNNVAIGAKYAQAQYGVDKVAVLDFDVHHGNGTEEGFFDSPSLFYGSTHELDNFPGTGPDPSPLVGELATQPVYRRIVNRTLRAGPRSRSEFHQKWVQILEEMELFAPDLVLISAGFDAHDEDPLASCELIEEDFDWVTAAILNSCVRINPSNPPPCVSILEGGYDLEALANSAVAHVGALLRGYPAIASVTGEEAVDIQYHGGDEVAALGDYLKTIGL